MNPSETAQKRLDEIRLHEARTWNAAQWQIVKTGSVENMIIITIQHWDGTVNNYLAEPSAGMVTFEMLVQTLQDRKK